MRITAFLSLFILLHHSARAGLPDTTINGVPVNFIYTPQTFPKDWMNGSINGKGESLEKNEVHRSGNIISVALAKYPISVLQNNLEGIYVLKSIRFYNVGYGGTNSTAIVYVTNNGSSLGYTDEYIEQTFHHEFSSILYRNYPKLLDSMAWIKAHGLNFNYNDPENGVGAIRKKQSSQELDSVLCEKGFLTQYAMSGMENDLNTLAQNLFSPCEGFWAYVDQFPKIREKVNILVRFYNRIHPYFTENYFRNQAK